VTAPYYADDTVRLYLGDCRELLPALGEEFDAAICDPPYGYTILSWDEWPTGWTQTVAGVTSSMWCFGSLRMFMAKAPEFAWSDWHLSHDVVWEKHNGTGFAADRFKGVHELVAHWYRGSWSEVHHDVPRTVYTGPDKHARVRDSRTPHTSSIGAHIYADDGTRLARSVQRHPSVRGGIHPTEKPTALLTQLIEYAVPPALTNRASGGVLLDPMAGSCSTAVAARLSGRRAVCIEAHEPYAEAAARRLDQGVLTFDGTEAS
jgi:site-specific DNA-methyltransferase (adenine-specific)